MSSTEAIFLEIPTNEFKNLELSNSLEWVQRICNYFITESEFLIQFSGDDSHEIKKLLSEDTVGRYKGMVNCLSYPYKNYIECDKEVKNSLEEGFLIQSWSSLGSVLESTLQIFLSVYYKDYLNSDWRVWKEPVIQELKQEIKDLKSRLDQSILKKDTGEDSALTTEVVKSFIKQINQIIKERSQLFKIEKITLSPLIDFYFSNEIFTRGDIDQDSLNRIRDYRNAIHSFQKRSIGSWEELNESLKYFLILLYDLLDRLPEIPEDIPIPEFYMTDKTEIYLQKGHWFTHKFEFNPK